MLQVLQDDQSATTASRSRVVVADTLEQRALRGQARRARRSRRRRPRCRLEAERSHAVHAEDAQRAGRPTTTRGDFDAAFANATVQGRPDVHDAGREPQPDGAARDDRRVAGRRQAHASTTRRRASSACAAGSRRSSALPKENVRVIVAFPRRRLRLQGLAVVARAARGDGARRSSTRPVKLVLTRQQMFALVGTGRRRPARPLGATPTASSPRSATTTLGDVALRRVRRAGGDPDAHALRVRRTSRPRTGSSGSTSPTPTFMRAPGEATGTFALESAMDELAYALEMDPLELRLRNYAETDPRGEQAVLEQGTAACYSRPPSASAGRSGS